MVGCEHRSSPLSGKRPHDTAKGRPVLVLLRPGTTPSGREVRAVLYLLIKRIRKHWPKTAITIRVG